MALGIPGSESAADLLDALARAGGTGASVNGGPAVQADQDATVIYEKGNASGKGGKDHVRKT